MARASFGLAPAEPSAVKATLADMRAARREAQPSGIKTFGSTFKNPEDPRAEGRSAGVLLDEAGCRGLAVGGARGVGCRDVEQRAHARTSSAAAQLRTTAVSTRRSPAAS